MSTRLLALLLALLPVTALVVAAPAPAQAQESWQFKFNEANTFYRNRLYPKALEALREVVSDPEGGKQLKAWQLIIEISTKLTDLDTMIWGLENGRPLAKGQEAAQMQAQLYRLKRLYGQINIEVSGGSGKLPTKGIKLKKLEEPEDPEVLAYLEKAVADFAARGYSVQTTWLPGGEYELDGEGITIVPGKELKIEVAPTTNVTFAIEVGGEAGYRGGDATTGAAGFLGGLELVVGPHIQFASGSALLVQAGPLFLVGAQSTPAVEQNKFSNDQRARLSIGGTVGVAFEFRIGSVDLSPRVGYAVGWLASGLYYKGSVISRPEGGPTGVLEGEFIVPAIAHGPRLGLQALVTPAEVKGKRRPRLFVGIRGGPLWASPLWGEVAGEGTAVTGIAAEADDDTARELGRGPFNVLQINAENPGQAKAFADVQAVVGIQVRL